MANTLKVLVVDDSAWMRKVITEMIADIEGLEVVGKARNGEVALKLVEKYKPDLVTLDMEMPVMNGLDTLKHLKALEKLEGFSPKVIMISSVNDHVRTMEALENGAEDFIKKPLNIRESHLDFKEKLEKHIFHLFERNEKKNQQATGHRQGNPKVNRGMKDRKPPHPLTAIVIGASTGGPRALTHVIGNLPKGLSVPVFVVQHMPEGFTTSFAERLNHLSAVPVIEAKDGMKIESGIVYLAPGGFHMILEGNHILLNQKEKVHGVRPAVDYLFSSAAEKYGHSLVGVILTGMGKDGTDGCKDIVSHGGYTLAQSKETSVIYGMPRSAIEQGVINEVADLNFLSERLNRMVEKENEPKL